MLEERLVAVRRALGSGKDGLALEHVPSGARDGAAAEAVVEDEIGALVT